MTVRVELDRIEILKDVELEISDGYRTTLLVGCYIIIYSLDLNYSIFFSHSFEESFRIVLLFGNQTGEICRASKSSIFSFFVV